MLCLSFEPRVTIAANEQGFLLWRHSLNVQPRIATRFCLKFEDKIYCLALFVTPEPLLILVHSR